MMRICSVFTLMRVLVFGIIGTLVYALQAAFKPLFFVQHGVCGRVVVHFHLPIYLHVYASLLDIGQQLVDSSGEVNLLFEQDI